MTQISVSRKSKIHLVDYPYKRDIENRLLMAHLSVFEVDVLREILHHSLTVSVTHLAEALDVEIERVMEALDKLSATKLFKQNRLTLTVDKEMRKYYESQIEKFDDDFEPNMEFIQGLLNKLPIHILPNWYVLPRNSDNIFASIVEKYFLTPKIYRQYLYELQFDDPILHQIIKDLYQAPHYKLYASQLIEKYKLEREQFEEYLLLLEYHFICCLSYNKVGDQWQEVITPFYEWLEYLRCENQCLPLSSQIQDQIERISRVEFGFITDMQILLKACSRKKLNIKDISSLFPKEIKHQDYLDQLLFKVQQLEFASCTKGVLQISDKGALWLTKPILEQAIALANNPLNILKNLSPSDSFYNPRNLGQIKKSLRRLAELQWVYLEDFVKSFIHPMTHKDPISLVNKGKKWKYALPTYNQDEQDFIKRVICERLFELGVVATGTYQGKPCFCLTPFGRHFIG